MANPAGWKVKGANGSASNSVRWASLPCPTVTWATKLPAAVVGDVALDVVQGVGVDVGLGVGGDERVGGAARGR